MIKINPVLGNGFCVKPAKKEFKNTSYDNKNYSYNSQIFRLNFTSNKYNPLPPDLKAQLPQNYTIAQLKSEAMQQKNRLGQGNNSIVYKIPYSEDYALKVLNKDDPNKITMGEFPDDVNLGQPVWQDSDNPRILILKRIKGYENSIPNWTRTIFNPEVQMPEDVTKEQAELYLSKVKAIASMPQESYDKLASKIKILDDKDYKLDSINPNNLMVNPDDKEINAIDYFKVPKREKSKHVYENSYMDIVALALDFTLLPEYFDKLSRNGQNELMDCCAQINSKAYLASIKEGLSCESEKFRTFIYYTIQWFQVMDNKENVRAYEKRADDFIEMLKNPWDWADNRRS